MQSLKKVLDWVFLSSRDPQEVSLTVKGALLGAIPTIMYLAGVAHMQVGTDTLTSVFDALASFVQALLTLIAAAATLYGAVRKAWLTVLKPTTTPGISQ
jgi:uncharacterized membrane protein